MTAIKISTDAFAYEESASWIFLAVKLYLGGFLFLLGACVGSFLNVVIYRLPRGMGLLRADSHCPVCKMPIPIKDNIPVLGWLKLRGRCRECATPISSRYVLIEAGTGLLFLYLAAVELFPVQSSFVATLENIARWPLPTTYAYHAFVLCVLVCSVFIAADGHRLPRRMIAWAWAVGLACPLLWQEIGPLPLSLAGWSTPFQLSWLRQLVTGLAGIAAGGLLGGILAVADGDDSQAHSPRRTMMIVLATIGCYFGWQGAIGVAAIAGLLQLVMVLVADRFPAVRSIPTVALPFVAVLLQIPLRGVLAGQSWWSGLESSIYVLAGVPMAILLIGLLVRRGNSTRRREQQSHPSATERPMA